MGSSAVMTKDKVRGMFLGGAIGDALGMPVETFSAERIAKEYGRVDKYHVPSGHKWFDGEEAGTWTDDTQLSVAVAEALIEADGFDMDTIAAWHVKAMKETTKGWGGSTRESVQRLSEGVHWNASGITKEPGRGTGNGICMKVAPFGAFFAVQDITGHRICELLADFALMTHQTSMAVSSGFIHTFGCYYCLTHTPEDFQPIDFINLLVSASRKGLEYKHSTQAGDDLTERMKYLHKYKEYTTERIITAFKGSCYCYDSVPFTYMFFTRSPMTLETLFETVSAGGDADSNGSMVGNLLGALHGSSIFPQHLIDGLKDREKLEDLVDRFCAKFGIQ